MRNPSKRSRKLLRALVLSVTVVFLSGVGNGQLGSLSGKWPDAEFHMARVKYETTGGAGSHGFRQPWWAVDYPFAEEHFFAALRRVTNLTVVEDEAFVELSDNRIFQYPFLFLQQPGAGYWRPTAQDAAN